MAVSHLRNTPITGKSYTTPVDATLSDGRATDLPGRLATEEWMPRSSLRRALCAIVEGVGRRPVRRADPARPGPEGICRLRARLTPMPIFGRSEGVQYATAEQQAIPWVDTIPKGCRSTG